MYYISKTVSAPFEKVVSRVKEELARHGFGVISEIDVQETLSKKLNVAFRKYRILGACNPPFAYQALQAEDKIGVLLPCNIIVQEPADGVTEAAAIDPLVSMQTVGNPRLKEIAGQVQEGLKAVIAAL